MIERVCDLARRVTDASGYVTGVTTRVFHGRSLRSSNAVSDSAGGPTTCEYSFAQVLRKSANLKVYELLSDRLKFTHIRAVVTSSGRTTNITVDTSP